MPQTPSCQAVFKILLVEDCEDSILLIRAFLKKYPYQLEVAYNGRKAVDMVKEGRYDLVLMDIQMPIMDGHAATQLIRAWEAEQDQDYIPLPIVALTAHSQIEDKQEAMAVGCNQHLTKPISKATLVQTIEWYYSKK